jgi:DNA segregation ATPase FtsK/SpoIIIE, S-DNA-T family
MYMPERSLVQEQRDLFHRLQQIFETDNNARAAVGTKRRDANLERGGEERALDSAQRKEKDDLEGVKAGYAVLGFCIIVGLLILMLCQIMSTTLGLEIIIFILLASILFFFATTPWKRSQERQHKKRMTKSQERYDQIIAELDQAIAKLDRELSQKLTILQPDFVKFVNDSNIWGLAWQDASWSQWRPATAIQLATRVGTFLPRHELLPPVPAFVSCPGGANLLFKVSGDAAKASAYNAIQSFMLRLLAFQPPGKVRFILIDPLGLGQNVAIFMRLADFDEKLVGNRAWSETRHIEQQLADLSEHMASVIQKYLQGQFSTIEEYNMQAGEVAEPYRVLVVTDFPARFSEEAIRRLEEIAKNGPRCGVFTIIMQETARPYEFSRNDLSSDDGYYVSRREPDFSRPELERISCVLTWDGQRIMWLDPDYSECQVQLDEPPALTLFNTILQEVGKAASKAGEVKVPFERVMPYEESIWWKASTRDGIRVPLGRAGASKLQYMELGKGTAQHVLIAGKTGAGKTNLLHVLLMNLALTYSPDELELYLIDFKTVGFTPYATFQLPHARVVATQSEREFAQSVLKGLDTLLEERKNIFRQSQVQDIMQYRVKNPDACIPRILLLVDEFQEFFTSDDTIAQEASLLLDRLVRQGRAFGMHVMLGSQTLSGTYTLARSTISQMAVRIALQCEEADSRLILSDDNPAARLLSRPGEAIYNASNGMLAGNNPFQCALLPEEELEHYLKRINAYAQHMQISHPWQQIIFDGDANASVEKNTAFDTALATPYPSAFPQRVTAWIGDPIAIKEAVTIQFTPRAGNNLIMVGQQDEVALGMQITTLLSLAAHYHPARACFYIFDFAPQDAPFAGYLQKIGQALPHQTQLVTKYTLAKAFAEIGDELTKRLDASTASNIPIYLFIYGLQRIRDLRPDDDMGYSAFGDVSVPPSLSRQFATILRNGPECGICTVVWCDTCNNLNRSLERGMLREFELRVVFQMSVEDSNNLIDAPVANTIGRHRAFLYVEDTGQLEKFRPYNVPSVYWLQRALSSIRQKCTPPQVASR